MGVDRLFSAQIADAARASENDVNEAVKSAKTAFERWAEVPARQRGALIQRCGELLKEHAEEIAKLTALETGKGFGFVIWVVFS